MTQPASHSERLRHLLFRRDLAMICYRATVCRRLGLDATELAALAHLLHHGPMTASRLGVLLGLSSGGITHVAQRLVQGGHVFREPHPRDRRSLLLALAPELQRRLPALLEPAADVLEAVVLDDHERRTVTAFLTSLAERSEAGAVPVGPADAMAPAPRRLAPSQWM